MSVVTNAARNVVKNAAPLERRSFALLGLPTTATVKDVQRAVRRRMDNIQISGVTIQYQRYQQTSKAVIHLVKPADVDPALRIMRDANILGLPIKTRRCTEAELKNEGAPLGTSLRGANHRGGEKKVVMWGLPGKLAAPQLEHALRDYGITTAKNGMPKVVKLPGPENTFTLYSRFCITMDSTEEAHRLVRNLHMTHWDKGKLYRLYARIVE